MNIEIFGYSFGYSILIPFIIVSLSYYIFSALAWVKIAKHFNFKYPWIAWIPLAKTGLILTLGNYPWFLVILFLLISLIFYPINSVAFLFVSILLSFVMIIIITVCKWKIYEKKNYTGALSLISLAQPIPFLGLIATITHLITLGLVAWQDKRKASLTAKLLQSKPKI